MSSLLDVALGNWIDSLTERPFDAPFLALLRAHGFYDIHFTHGQYEFGKDFIAKRNEPEPVQYGIQSKAGDIAGGEWTSILGQLEELIDTLLVHPNFDAGLPKQFVLATTGRLVGKAIIGTTSFQNRLRTSDRGEFTVWDRDTLLEMLTGSARFRLPHSPDLLPILGMIESGVSTDISLERALDQLSSTAITRSETADRAFVDISVCALLLIERGRPFQALSAALAAVRLFATAVHQDTAHAGRLHEAMRFYVGLGTQSLHALSQSATDPNAWLKWSGGAIGILATYPVACLRAVEFFGLAALYCETDGDAARGAAFAATCKKAVEHQPGCAHPISDRYATSLSATVLALAHFGHQTTAADLIKRATRWVCDRYDGNDFGLAGPYATPIEEVRTLLGAPFESVALSRRRESLLAVALADLAYVVEPALYPLVVNDFQAVDATPTAVHADDDPGAYSLNGGATQALVNIAYPDSATNSPLPHHALQPTARVPEIVGGPVICLAIACLLRDRLFSDCYRRVVIGGRP